MFKNVASQKFIVFAFDASTNIPKAGDAANITAYVAKDFGAVTVLGDTSATEMDATNAPGYYLFDAAQAETNADCLLVSGKSSTSNIKVLGAPATIFTLPASFTSSVAQTGDSYARLGAPAGASIAADLAEIEAETDGIAAISTATPLTAAQIATGVWQDATAGDFTAASSIGKSLYTSGVVPGGTNGLFIAGTNAATTVTTSFTTTFTGSLTGSVASVTGAVGSVTGAVGSVTGAVGSVTAAVTLTAGERNSIADALLARNIAGGSSSGRIVTDALRFLRNKWSISGTTLTVTAEDDTATAWTATITTDAAALPITSSDPA